MTGAAIDRHELVVDNFAGGGGASLGIEQALGRQIDIAINHDDQALAMHRANHPKTEHLCQNIWQVDPDDIRRRGPVGLAWFSPDCSHHSKAKGGRPRKKNIRDLAWVVVLWAQRAKPRVIILENVEEFEDWGPLDSAGMPIADQKGVEFRRWIRELKKAGYRVEYRNLRACNYGTPTIRKRLFLIARRDGQPIVWPMPTHGPGLRPYRTAAEIIDWSIPCPSIFLTREEVKELGLRCKRPLAEATMRRIARGVWKYVITAADPFIVPVTHTTDDRVQPITEPLRTVTTAKGGEFSLVYPFFAQRYGEREGQEPRTRPVTEPIQTVVPTGNGANLVAAMVSRQFGQSVGQTPGNPLGTVTAGGGGKSAVVSAFLAQHNGGMVGHDARKPVSTIVERGSTQAIVAANLSHQYGSATNGGQGDPREPLKTVSTGGHHAVVASFLTKYYGEGGQLQDPREPLHTATTKDRMSAVTVTIDGTEFVTTDIGMRMLTARELFRAQGFPEDYVIAPDVNGKPMTKTAQVAMCGNSVCPPIAEAIVAANFAASERQEGKVA